jgi:hypothetical protein
MPTVLRPHLLPSTTVKFAVNDSIASQIYDIQMSNGGSQVHLVGPPVPAGAWIVAAPPIKNSSGQTIAAHEYPDCFPVPTIAKAGPPSTGEIVTCLGQYNLHESVTYQPASHYWPLQWYESGIFLALAVLLSGSCFWLVNRRQV